MPVPHSPPASPLPEASFPAAGTSRPPWGPYTTHALQTYPIGPELMPVRLLHAFGLQKQAAAAANGSLGEVASPTARAIAQAAQELAKGQLDAAFPLGVWQAGDGNQTHLNVNEVLAVRATALHPEQAVVHALDQVNRNQSSNDSWPTAVRLALLELLQGPLDAALVRLLTSLDRFAAQHREVVKVGRTFLRDAHFTSVGAEFRAFACLLDSCRAAVRTAGDSLLTLPQGAGAVGTGMAIHPDFSAAFVQALCALTGQPFRAEPLPSSAQVVDLGLLRSSAALAEVSIVCLKLCRDIELLASGPRCGIGELTLPNTGPGSSSMAGKVNPTHASMLEMMCVRVQANHQQVCQSLGSARLQLNTTYLLAARCVLESAELLAQGLVSFAQHCVEGLGINTEQLAVHAAAGPGAVYLRSRDIGYEAAQGVDR